ncbi:MAG: DUF1577 domain-containing protein [Spirochaetia bacterium]|nr:DUF1577 domain-containing protein [Spirochaetia bacterium]
MAVFHERKPRKFQQINDSNKIEEFIDRFLLKETFFLRGVYDLTPAKIISKESEKEILIEMDRDVENEISLYKVIEKYVEIACVIKERQSRNLYLIEIIEIKIALEGRKYPRLPIERDRIMITNVRASKHVISSSLFTVPTSVKVYFKQYEQKLKEKADTVHIEVFDRANSKLELIRKTGKMLYISDTQDEYSYASEDPKEFVNYRENIEDDIQKIMFDYKNRNIGSELIVPIVFIGHDGKHIPIGYIQLINKETPVEVSLADELKEMAAGMIEKIREANAIFIHSKQGVRNISVDGLRVLISDFELKKNLIQQTGFSFDILFSGQKPINVFSEIKYFGTNPAGDALIGVKINGFSGGKEEHQRYLEMIDAMTPKERKKR